MLPSVITQKFARPSTALLAVALVSGFASSATAANLCSPPPTFVPGLYGAPAWKSGSQLRPDLSEPRWAASPLTGFANDASATKGLFRLMASEDGTKLLVSMQTSYDDGSLTTQDKVFFGISENVGATNNTASAVMIRLRTGAPAGTYIDANQFTSYSYDAADATPWDSASTPPTWVKDPGSWSSEPAAALVDWGINFVVDLAALGITPADSFKLALGMVIRDGVGNDSTIYTPAAPLPGGTVVVFGPSGNLLATPSAWAPADATQAGCAGGITLGSSQIWTNNPVDSQIATDAAHVNVFSAQPSFGVVPVTAGTLKGEFRIANWGTIADANAGWQPIPSATGLSNAATTGLLQFTCPANAGGQTCGMATPGETHQCVQVRLNHGPGYNHTNAPITTASAYRNMNFLPLSTDKREAEISLAGLPSTASGKRDVYLYVYPTNLPPQGNEQLYLDGKAMATTLRDAFAPPPPPVQVQSEREAGALLASYRKQQVGEARARAKQNLERQLTAEERAAGAKVPSLVTAEQALTRAWPGYEVRPYYDSGSTSTDDGQTFKGLVPMPPFLMYFSHQGPLFGFSHELSLVSGGTWNEIRKPTATAPGIYKLNMDDDGVAKVATSVTAHEEPVDPAKPVECEACEHVEVHEGRCNCSTPGLVTRHSGAWLLSLLAVGLAFARRRRAAA